MASEGGGIKYLKPEAVMELLVAASKSSEDEADARAEDIVVIDVRESDYAGGHIRGAVNVPGYTFPAHVKELVDKYKHKDKVIFHCMQSQVRGPRAAGLFTVNLRQVKDATCEVCILKGGFHRWVYFWNKLKKDNPDIEQLTEDYDPSEWEYQS